MDRNDPLKMTRLWQRLVRPAPGHLLPALTGEHGGEGEQDGHGDGQPLGDTLGGQEEGEPGDGQVDRGGEVGLDQVVPGGHRCYTGGTWQDTGATLVVVPGSTP